MTKATHFGVSVSPGDPELITLKAIKTIENCPVIAAPRTSGGRTLALDIAKQCVDLSNKQLLCLDFPMTDDAEILADRHLKIADDICALLESGMDVAMLNLGDVSIFGTFTYISKIIKDRGFNVFSIAGVPSFCACAAELNTSLTEMKQPLHIFPASFDGLEEALKLNGGKVIMKSGKAINEVLDFINKNGLSDKTSLISDCGLPTQRIYKNHIFSDCDNLGYFTTIIIKP